MKLQVGRSYKNRLGQTVTITAMNYANGTYVDSDGTHYSIIGEAEADGAPNYRDLVECISETPMKSTLTLEVGKTYETRNGKHAKVVYIDDVAQQPVVARVDEGLESYYFDGQYLQRPHNIESSMDIIKEVRPTKRITGWVNIYGNRSKPHLGMLFDDRTDADIKADTDRTHVMYIDVDAEEV
jgi:hypothetical protein